MFNIFKRNKVDNSHDCEESSHENTIINKKEESVEDKNLIEEEELEETELDTEGFIEGLFVGIFISSIFFVLYNIWKD